jgi:FkbM family methyltransferase
MRLQRLAIKALKRCYVEFRFLLWEINRKFRKSVTVSTKQGVFTVLLAPSESIGQSLFCKGQYELDLMQKTMAFLRSIGKCPPKGKGTIVDVGANNGVISIGMLYTGELEKAIAIEPEPQNFALLQHNVNQNGLKDKVLCLPYAIASQKGEILLELSDTNFGDHRVRTNSPVVDSTELFHESERRVITIQADQLDNLLAGLPESFVHDIAVIWVDVQGYEGYVFMGAKNLLSKGIPVVSEIWPYGMRRAGMTQEQFCDIARSIWTNYWVLRRGRFVRYPIATLDILFDELGYDGDHENIIFTK